MGGTTESLDLPGHPAKDLKMSKRSGVCNLFARVGVAARAGAVLAVLSIGSTLAFSTAPALAAECPNETIREEQGTTGLPQCRAYELVTNPFKEGFAPLGGIGIPMTGVDGAFVYFSPGNFAGNAVGQNFNEYVATRTPTGWSTLAPSPSGVLYTDEATAQAVSPDLRSSLWLMRLPGESSELEDYYLRSPDGSFTRIGPALNPTSGSVVPPGTTVPYETGPFTENVSADLSHVVFDVYAPRAFPGPAPSGQHNLYEYVGTGNERPQLVGVDNDGNLISSGGTEAAGISTDGRVVLFVPSNEGLWARINETTSIDVSASDCTRTLGDPGGACNGPGEVQKAGMASDGSRVFFTTTQQLVNGDTDQTPDLYACDIPAGTPAPVGLANPCASLNEVSGAATGANVQRVVSVSEDGSRVYFVATGVLAANADSFGEHAISGNNNLYVAKIDAAHPAGQTTFVTKLQSGEAGFHPQTTADGRYLAFTTTSQLLPGDTDEAADLYRYDADTGTLLRLSIDTSGAGGNTPGLEVSFNTNGGPSGMSADGSTVVFQTNEGLSPADTNGIHDAYEWHEGVVSLISSGRPSTETSSEEKFAAISPSGTDIYFGTTGPLTANDIDTNSDVYDARIDGGFSFAQRSGCSGEACQGEPASQPASPGASASATFNGPGSATPAEAPPANPPKPKPLTRAQKFAKALKACKARPKKKRTACVRQARRTYGSSR